mmetsp:Transcript_12968/g.14360  ORF Transcript_12968/g.14360 Transcript_12968/m.14360 type:complete len:506 (+) Transcript_12968:66-1583(+)
MLLLVVCVSLVVFLILNTLYISNYKKQLSAPGPFVPIMGIGKLLLFLSYRKRVLEIGLYPFIVERFKMFGSVWGLKGVDGRTKLLVAEPSCLEHVLKGKFGNYIKGPKFQYCFKELFGDGIFNVNGEEWKKQRKVASHLFKTREIRQMLDVFNKHAQQVMHIINKSASSGSSIDIQSLFARYTLDSIAEIAFGYELDSLNEQSQDTTKKEFASSFNRASALVAWTFLSPFYYGLRKLPWLQRLFFGKEMEEQTACIKKMDDVIYHIINKRKTDTDHQLEKRQDLLSGFFQYAKKNNVVFSDTYLRDITLNFMLAGRDTTSAASAFCAYLLAKNPDKQEKVIAEIDKHTNGQLPDYDTIKKLSYLRACIDETLRLYPPVPADPKESVDHDKLPNGTVIQPGTDIVWFAYAQGRMEEYWDEPLKFLPERWLGDSKENLMKHPYQFIPFHAGPRTCLGKQMAYTEVAALLCCVLQKYKLDVVGVDPPKLALAVTLMSENGVCVRAISR